MSNYTKIEFEDIVVYIDQLRINIYDSVMQEVFSTRSPKIAVWHDLNIHYYHDNDKDVVGVLDCAFLNDNPQSRKTIFLDLHLRAKGKFDTDAELFSKIVKFAHSFITDHVKENQIKDENGQDFKIPDLVFTEEDFKLVFPN
jgi:hypothetical protein